jgi:hypothetical protein
VTWGVAAQEHVDPAGDQTVGESVVDVGDVESALCDFAGDGADEGVEGADEDVTERGRTNSRAVLTMARRFASARGPAGGRLAPFVRIWRVYRACELNDWMTGG